MGLFTMKGAPGPAEHEHVFPVGEDYTDRLTDDSTCTVCGVTVLQGFQLDLEWEMYERPTRLDGEGDTSDRH